MKRRQPIQKEQGRKKAEEQLRLIIEAAPNEMIMVDREGKITLVNRQTETLFGYTREELLGQRIEVLVPERYRANHPGHRQRFFSDPKVRSMGAGRDLFGLCKDGSEIPIEIGLSPVEMPEGPMTLASIIDITERRKAEAEIAAKSKELETLLYITSHDLTEPLRAIENFSQMLLDIRMPKKDGFEVLKEIKSDPALKSLPVVILTTSQQEEDVVKSYAYGACSFITKPVGFEPFQKMVVQFELYWALVARVPAAKGG